MKILLSAAVISALLVMDANAIEASPEPIGSPFYDELSRRDISHRMALIRSRSELGQHISAQGSNSPLSVLSTGGRTRFIQSLVFTEKGLASFDYSDLRSELTASQVFRILRLFGVEHAISSIPNLRTAHEIDSLLISTLRIGIDPEIDYNNYSCVSKATCSYTSNSICIGDNC